MTLGKPRLSSCRTTLGGCWPLVRGCGLQTQQPRLSSTGRGRAIGSRDTDRPSGALRVPRRLSRYFINTTLRAPRGFSKRFSYYLSSPISIESLLLIETHPVDISILYKSTQTYCYKEIYLLSKPNNSLL